MLTPQTTGGVYEFQCRTDPRSMADAPIPALSPQTWPFVMAARTGVTTPYLSAGTDVRAVWLWGRAVALNTVLSDTSTESHETDPVELRVLGVLGSRAWTDGGLGRPRKLSVEESTWMNEVKSAPSRISGSST